jgi:hypothetical protein
MARFLVEVPHEEETIACAKALKILLETGSHFLTNADWGCLDGDHRGWITVEMGSRDEALAILPVAYRAQAKVIQLNKFSVKDLDDIIRHHKS